MEKDTPVSLTKFKQLEAVNAKLQDRLQKLLSLAQESRAKYEGQIQQLTEEKEVLQKQQQQQQQQRQLLPTPSKLTTEPSQTEVSARESHSHVSTNSMTSPSSEDATKNPTKKNKHKKNKNKNKNKNENENENENEKTKTNSTESIPNSSLLVSKIQNPLIIKNKETTSDKTHVSLVEPGDSTSSSLQKPSLENLPTNSATSSQFSLLSNSTTSSEVLLCNLTRSQKSTQELHSAYQGILEDVLQFRKQHVTSIREASQVITDYILKLPSGKDAKMIESLDPSMDWEQKYHELKKELEESRLQHDRRFIRSKEQWQKQSEENLQQLEADLKKAFIAEKKKELEKIQEDNKASLQELTSLKEEYKSLRSQSRGLTRRNEEYKEKIKIYETQLFHLTQESEQWKEAPKQLEELQTAFKNSQNQLQGMQIQYQALQLDYEKEQLAHQVTQTKHAESLKEFETKLEDLRVQLAQARSSSDEHQRRMTSCVEELNTSKALFASKSAELDSIHLKFTLATHQHEEVLQRQKEVEEKLQHQLSVLQNEKQTLEKQSEQTIQGLNHQLRTTFRLVEEQQTQCENLSLQLQASTSEYQELVSRFQVLQDQLTDTETSLNESQVLVDEFEQNKEHYAAMKKLHDSLLLDLEKLNVKQHQLQQVNRSLKEEVKKLQLRNSPRSSTFESPMFPSSLPPPASTSTASSPSLTDSFNIEYFKSVLFKFLMQKKQMRHQLIPVLSMLLKCNEDELEILHSVTFAALD
ncbi:hypothetical protein HMI55_000814 [Coelomomyces lativittatus]|nr:hypothetical protein HMI55_000814 [Coelomomyces lativittatus]